MKVVPFKGRKGDIVAEVDGILLLFDRRGTQPKAGETIEVMITHAPPYRWKDGYHEMSKEDQKQNPPTIPFLFVRPVNPVDDVLISHKGFECSGSMCRTTAHVTAVSHGDSIGWVTPGRSPVREAFNVNVRFDGGDRSPLHPGQAYVNMKDQRDGLSRIVGLPRLEDVDETVLSLLARRRVTAAA